MHDDIHDDGRTLRLPKTDEYAVVIDEYGRRDTFVSARLKWNTGRPVAWTVP
jgi:hypothetical protein